MCCLSLARSSETLDPVGCFSVIEIKIFDELFSLSGSQALMEGGLGCVCRQELLQQVLGRMDTGADPGDMSSPVSPGVKGAKGLQPLSIPPCLCHSPVTL